MGKEGTTSYAQRRIDEQAYSAFSLIFCDSIIKQIALYTNQYASSAQSDFWVTSDDILAFVGVLYCRGVFCRNHPVHDMWSANYGIPIVSRLMTRNKFLQMMKFIRFDSKETRQTRVRSDPFCLIRDIWDRFIRNSQACYSPGQFVTVDEQLVASKTRCLFTQFMPNKPDKFGIKFGT